MDEHVLEEIEQKISYCFADKKLLQQAFTHSSFANIEKIPDNERMEFFGDAILEYLSSEYLFSAYRNCTEGQLSSMRAGLVSAEALYPVVDRLGLIPYLQVVKGEISHKIGANLYEALLCAIYLDGGLPAARRFFEFTMLGELKQADIALKKDCKTRLQEYCQKRHLELQYRFVGRDGPDNKPLFHYELLVDGAKQTDGSGSSKKAAEQDAANNLITKWRID